MQMSSGYTCIGRFQLQSTERMSLYIGSLCPGMTSFASWWPNSPLLPDVVELPSEQVADYWICHRCKCHPDILIDLIEFVLIYLEWVASYWANCIMGCLTYNWIINKWQLFQLSPSARVTRHNAGDKCDWLKVCCRSFTFQHRPHFMFLSLSSHVNLRWTMDQMYSFKCRNVGGTFETTP